METYVLGFNIFDARGLVTPDGGLCDPFVVVECCGKTYQTETKVGKATIVTWNENFIWSDIQLYREQFKSAYVTFSVYARNWFTRNTLIGRCYLQLENVRNRRNHLYAKKWLTLREDDESEPRGTIKLTVFCLSPGDPAPSADQQEAGDEEGEEGGEDYEDLSKAVLGGKVDGGAGKPHHVLVTIHRVEDLPAQEGWFGGKGGINPFITVEFAGACISTSLAKNVQQHTFNETILLPVVTPVFEDTIIIKLWNYFALSPDELLAQGLLSFSKLRNTPMNPQWFNFYGWNPEEIKDVSSITSTGETLEPNFYRGKLLVSARVDRLDNIEDLQDAGKFCARASEEPPQVQLILLCDVYTVHGADGRECSVEVTIGAKKEETAEWVFPSEATDHAAVEHNERTRGEASVFQFNENQGRIPPIVTMVPEDPPSQPDVMVNVYTRGLVQGKTRIGYAVRPLKDVAKYDAGNHAVPVFFCLKPMPWNATQKAPSSCLLTIEQHHSDDIVRHRRKQVKAGQYVVRAYIFMARAIKNSNDAEPNYFVKASCAGAVAQTQIIHKDMRPVFMTCLELNTTLMCDHPKKPPTMEPITITLLNDEGLFNKVSIGKANCRYTYLRQKNVLQITEMFDLTPQWVKLYGGSYNSLVTGEILLSFELLRRKDQAEFPPAKMYPVPQKIFEQSLHLTPLRKATLHYSLLGLRDLQPTNILGGMIKSGVSCPVVEIRVRKLIETDDHKSAYYKTRIKWTKECEGANETKQEDRNKKWLSKRGTCFEFLRCGKLKVELPDMAVFDPWATVTVFEEGMMGAESNIGECRINLGSRYPWRRCDEKEDDCIVARKEFREQAEEERERVANEIRKSELKKRKSTYSAPQKEAESLNSQALPLALQHVKRKPVLNLKETPLNMKFARSHNHMVINENSIPLQATGEKQHRGGEGGGRPEVEGKLEDSTRKPFAHDFWFKNIPLTRGLDLSTSTNEKVEPQYIPRVYGFAKIFLKLEEGWDDDSEEEEEGRLVVGPDGANPRPRKQSPGVPEELDSFAFQEGEFRARYKTKRHVPSRIRVRLYFVKGVCIYGKGAGFADPYLEFQMGSGIFVSMRNMYQVQTNTPGFYRLEERDIVLPDEGQLEVSLRDYDDMLGLDAIIGSTSIDLEDRWHSTTWKDAMEKQQVPAENRGLWTIDAIGQSRGTLEMWVEMLDSVKASDLKASDLRAPPGQEIEVRLVLWTTKSVRMVDGDHTDVMISTTLDCQEYRGSHPLTQETDVHFNCTDGNAVFNWRVVFPNIKMPVKSATLQLSLFDANSVSANVFIGDVNLDLKKYIEKVAKDMDQLTLNSWLKFGNMGEEEDNPDIEIGYVNVSMWVLTQSEADANEVGIARNEPNVNPQLITPIEGRGWGDFLGALGLGFTMPEFGLMGKLLWLMVLFLIAIIALKQLGLLG